MKKTLIAAALLVTVALTGCTTIRDSLTNRHELAFDDYTAAADGWESLPDWVPTDATDVRVRETTNAPIAIVGISSASDPVDCTEAERKYIPGLGGDWAPTDYPHSVLRCGDYEVMATDTGWFGWTISQTDMTGTPSDD
jgi:hypothetical protein